MYAIQHHCAETIEIVTPVCDSQILRGCVVDLDRSRLSSLMDRLMDRLMGKTWNGKTRNTKTGGGLQRGIEVRTD